MMMTMVMAMMTTALTLETVWQGQRHRSQRDNGNGADDNDVHGNDVDDIDNEIDDIDNDLLNSTKNESSISKKKKNRIQ
jgi:hypothetical protein